MDPGNYPILDDLVLKFSDDGKYLQAEFPAALERNPINLGWFQEQLNQRGLDEFELNKDALNICIKEFNDGKNASTINIAEKLDGEFTIQISRDVMSAHLNIYPPKGGEAVNKQMILEKIEELGITTGLNEAEIDIALEKGDAQDVLIASGEEPEHGKDGYFENLIPQAKDRRPYIDDKGIAHYHDIGELITVKPGDPLLRRHPATQGKAGIDIKGQEISPKPGDEMMFAPNLFGTKLAENDSHLLLADISGQPILVDHGAIVEQTIIVNNVDLSTGNIKFDGTVVVKGDVTTGLEIKTTGDVYIHGMVEEACRIEAGGDIAITQGVIGRGSLSEENGHPGKGIVQMRCQGSISAKFIENCAAYAGKEILVGELVAHSYLCAKEHVIVGKKGSRRGQIMGGVTEADLLVQAQIIGTQGGNHTKIEVGSINKYEKRLTDIDTFTKTKLAERANIEKVYTNTFKAFKNSNEANKPPMLEKLQHTLDRLALEISKLNRQKKTCEQCMEKLRSAKIQVSKQVLSAVEFVICDTARKFNLEHVGGTFAFDSKESKVEFHP